MYLSLGLQAAMGNIQSDRPVPVHRPVKPATPFPVTCEDQVGIAKLPTRQTSMGIRNTTVQV